MEFTFVHPNSFNYGDRGGSEMGGPHAKPGSAHVQSACLILPETQTVILRANILSGRQKKLYLGNLSAKRDWGFAPEYVEMMWLMLQQNEPDDYVIGTGESYSVRDFTTNAFGYAGIEIEWRGKRSEEKGIVRSVEGRWESIIKPGEVMIEVDPRYFRPTEVEFLKADITKAKTKLKWQPRVTLDELIKVMVDYDLKMVSIEPPGEGIRISKPKGFAYTNHDFSFYEKIKERF